MWLYLTRFVKCVVHTPDFANLEIHIAKPQEMPYRFEIFRDDKGIIDL